jgi:hypothetical protein
MRRDEARGASARGPIRVAALACVVGAALLGAVSCGDRASSAVPDGGDSALLARARDGAAGDGPLRVDSGASVDDLAMPAPESEELSARMRHLLEAVAQNNPALANDALFPRDAFIQTRDAPDPQKAWDKRLEGAFRRSVERSHKRTKGIEGAKFTGFQLGHAVMQGAPKKHEWKRPLWRVKHSKLTFTLEGKPRHLEIAEMTAWRGAWYVTRLR